MTWVWPRRPAQWLVSILGALLVTGLIFAGVIS